MKINFISTTYLLLLTMANIGLGCHAQTNVTSSFLNNAGFDNGAMVNNAPEGWTLSLSTSGVQSKISTAEKGNGVIAGGQNHWQLWMASDILAGRAHQTIDRLPLGRYKLSAAITPSFEGDMKLYLGTDSTNITSGENKVYEVETLVSSENDIDLGVYIKTTKGILVDIDDFTLYRYELTVEDATKIVDCLHQICVNDTLSRGRQKWYNRDEMLVAFDAYNNMGDNGDAIIDAAKKLQQAHETFLQIKSDYVQLRTEATSLYKEIQKLKFAYVDSVDNIRKQIFSYYSKMEDHYEWVKTTLASLHYIMEVYEKYKELTKSISYANTQMKATSYDGMAALQTVFSEAWQVATTATSTEEFDTCIKTVNLALDTYLSTRPSEWITIKNGLLHYTDNRATVQAHAPGFVRVGDIWYMCGEDRSNQWNPDVNLYSSIDLVHWKFEKKIIQNGVTTPELGSSRMIERPKLLYNKKTGKYVVWCHYEAGNYGASEAACFECDSVNGAYKCVWSGRPMGIKSRDCNVFQDTDGTAYFISTTEENQHLGLFRLSDDYHEVVEHTQLFAWQRREAPAIVRIGNTYFMFSSACSGWDPNQCKLSYSSNLKSGWSSLTNIGNSISYDTQAAAILEIKGTKATTYLYVGDRWQDPGLAESKIIMFPITFNGNSCTFKYHERFDINFVTGEWRETPTEDVFISKKDWKVIDYSSQEGINPATYAIDGNTNTFWHTQYSGTVAEAPHHITIDLGKQYNIQSLLATPRMDGNTNGLIRKYQFLVSNNGSDWKSVRSGDWMPYCTELFVQANGYRYIRLVCTEGTFASLAELDLTGTDVSTGIENTGTDENNKKIASCKLITLNGQVVKNANKGIYIEKTTYTDGTVHKIKKVIN